MDIKKTLYTLVASLLLFSSCENGCPTFDDADACVGFSSASFSINETDGKVEIPVYLASVAGLSGSATIEVDVTQSTAVEGADFTVVSKELIFSADGRTQNVVVNIVDNDVFTGDKKVFFKIVSSSVNLSNESTCTLTIVDDEHPLKSILYTYSGTAISCFEGTYDMEITLEKDESDLSKVWISNLDPYFFSYGYTAANGYNRFYGIVNEDCTEISVPVGQTVGYEDVNLEGLDGPDPDTADMLNQGQSFVIKIVDGGNKLEIVNAYGVANAEGFWECYKGGTVLTRQ